jgi:hypothetical protein
MERTLAIDKFHPRWRPRGKKYERVAQNTGNLGLSRYFGLNFFYINLKLKCKSFCVECMKQLMTASGCVDEWRAVWVPDGKG